MSHPKNTTGSPVAQDSLTTEVEFCETPISNQGTEMLKVAAIARAIARDVDTGGGADVPVLADLAKYFDDSGATSLEAAFDQLKKIAALVPAPRSAQLENVARESGVSSHES